MEFSLSLDGVTVTSDDHLETLRRCGGYYTCPKAEGRRFCPLVGYAGRYDASDGSKKQWVGEVYANFAMAEEYPHVLFHYARRLKSLLLPYIGDVDVFCGAPIGGYDITKMLGLVCGRRAVKAEKEVTALKTETSREQSRLVFARHAITLGLRYAIVEDVCHNFSTTAELVKLIESDGGIVSVIVCLLNRSLTVRKRFTIAPGDSSYPVVSLVDVPIPEYRQDDPAVADDVAAGNVVLKPKNEWPRLMEAMARNRAEFLLARQRNPLAGLQFKGV